MNAGQNERNSYIKEYGEPKEFANIQKEGINVQVLQKIKERNKDYFLVDPSSSSSDLFPSSSASELLSPSEPSSPSDLHHQLRYQRWSD